MKKIKSDKNSAKFPLKKGIFKNPKFIFMRNAILLISILYSLGLFFLPKYNFAQNVEKLPDKDKISSSDIREAFENAMRNIEQEKSKKQSETAAKLNSELNSAINKWLDAKKSEKNSQLNNFVDQKWENLLLTGPRFHYNYTLKDFKYIQEKTDISATQFLNTSHVGTVDIIEKLYVDKEHPANRSDFKVEDFFYTVTSHLKLTFEYRDQAFELVNVVTGQQSINQGWDK